MEVQQEPSTQPAPAVGEPTVLDYVKARLTFWRPTNLHIPDSIATPEYPGETPADAEPIPGFLEKTLLADKTKSQPVSVPWVVLGGLMLTLAAQMAFEPPDRKLWIGIGLYLLAALVIGWGGVSGRLDPAPIPGVEHQVQSGRILVYPIIVAGVAGLAAFFFFSSDQFNAVNVILWLLAIAAFFAATWIPRKSSEPSINRWIAALRRKEWFLPVSRWVLLFLVTAGVVLFFRLHQFNQVPSEMVSDHAEKLLDISDVLNGQLNTYFPRNTGREAFQFYLTALIIKVLNTGLTFASLKIGTVLAGLVTLWYVYLLGKEIGSRWVGLLAFAFCGIAYWPNVISRFGLRFPLYPLFVAPALFYLIRGLRTANRNDFLLAGVAVGLGLHGYSPFRIVPFVVVAAVGLYLLHRQSLGERSRSITNLILLAAVALLIFLPLLRYSIQFPEVVASRSLTRISTTERTLPGPVGQLFLQNLWNATTMPFWSDGEIWVHSIPFRPALDVVTAALFFCGLVLVALRYIRQRHWLDLFLIVSIPLLMMPSILSLAFPGENPSLNRTGGAYIPVFLIAAIGLEGLLRTIKERMGSLGVSAAWAVGLTLFLLSASQNYDLVFHQYKDQYDLSAMNTSEAGNVIRGFVDSVGSPDTAWVVAYPYWLDTRLVGINAGFPTRDYAIWPKDIQQTAQDPRTKLFLVNPQDAEGLSTLRTLYPHGMVSLYHSRVEGKDFYMYLAPGLENITP